MHACSTPPYSDMRRATWRSASLHRALWRVRLSPMPPALTAQASFAVIGRNTAPTPAIDEMEIRGYTTAAFTPHGALRTRNVTLQVIGAHMLFQFSYDVAVGNPVSNFSLDAPTRMIFAASPDSALVFHGDTKLPNVRLTLTCARPWRCRERSLA